MTKIDATSGATLKTPGYKAKGIITAYKVEGLTDNAALTEALFKLDGVLGVKSQADKGKFQISTAQAPDLNAIAAALAALGLTLDDPVK